MRVTLFETNNALFAGAIAAALFAYEAYALMRGPELIERGGGIVRFTAGEDSLLRHRYSVSYLCPNPDFAKRRTSRELFETYYFRAATDAGAERFARSAREGCRVTTLSRDARFGVGLHRVIDDAATCATCTR